MHDNILRQPRSVTEAINMLIKQHLEQGETLSEISDFVLIDELKECFGMEANRATIAGRKSEFAQRSKRPKATKSSRFSCIESGLKALAKRAAREWDMTQADFIALAGTILADWERE